MNSEDYELVAYIDANVLIEYHQLQDHDWRTLLGAKRVRLVISSDVADEVDSFKDRGGVPREKRRRAERAAKQIDGMIGPAPHRIQEGVWFEYDDNPRPDQDYADNRLDKGNTDHRILAAVIRRGKEETAARVVLVSGDGGARRAAKRRGIETLEPDPAKRYPPAVDEDERKIRELEKQLVEARSREPKLRIYFMPPCLELLSIKLPQPFGTSGAALAAARYLAFLEKTFQPLCAAQSVHAYRFGVTDGRALNAYDAELKQWKQQMRNHLPAFLRFQDALARFVPINLHVDNKGTEPADAADVCLAVDGDLSLAIDLPRPSPFPSPPRHPGSETDPFVDLRTLFREPDRTRAMLSSLFPTGWTIGDERTTARFKLGELRHNDARPLPLLFLQVPEDCEKATIFAEVHARNLPHPLRTLLTVGLHKEPGPQLTFGALGDSAD